MKKLLLLLVLALCAGMGLWAQDAGVDPFAAIEAEELCADEMKNVLGSQHPDMYGHAYANRTRPDTQFYVPSFDQQKKNAESAAKAEKRLRGVGIGILDTAMLIIGGRVGTGYAVSRIGSTFASDMK